MDALGNFFFISRLVEVVMGLTLLEGVALAAYHHLTGRGLAARDYALNLFSGLCLMLALRSVVVEAGEVWTALFLTTAGLGHVADLICRWRRQQH